MLSVTHILCPVDFSDSSRRALDHAIALARWFHARISVLYVHRPTLPMFCAAPLTVPPVGDAPLDARERDDILRGMAHFVEPDRASGVQIDLVLRESLHIAATIVDVSEELHADLITVGTEGRTGVKRFLLGSVAEAVLRTARRPVLTVTPHVAEAVPFALGTLERIICAVDFSRSARRGLQYAAMLGEASGAQVTVAHILELPPELAMPKATLADDRLRRFHEAHRQLEALLTPELRSHCAIDHLVLAGRPAPEIIRLAAEQQAALVVMGARGGGPLNAVLRGSTTEQVVRLAPCPVLTLRG